MNTTNSSPTLPASVLVERVAALRTQISAAFIGQADVLDQLRIARQRDDWDAVKATCVRLIGFITWEATTANDSIAT